MTASQHRIGWRDPEITLVEKSMAEATMDLGLLELSSSIDEEDIVGVSFDQTFLSVSTLEDLTTGKLEFFGREGNQLG